VYQSGRESPVNGIDTNKGRKSYKGNEKGGNKGIRLMNQSMVSQGAVNFNGENTE